MGVAPTIIHSLLKRRALGVFQPSTRIGWRARINNLTRDPQNLRIGRFSRIDGEIIIYPGASVSIGNYCYIGAGTRLWAYSSICLDDYVIISHNVSIMDSTTHPLDFSERRAQVEAQLSGTPKDPGDFDLKPAPIHMAEGVWVCAGAVILRGSQIGREAIIAAGAVVRGEVSPRSMVR